MLDLLQAFNKDGQLLLFLGGHGHFPGQFMALTNVYVDKQNRVFTSEQYPGRVQMFRYVSDAEAEQATKEKEEQRGNERAAKEQAKQAAATATGALKPEAKPEVKQ